MVCNVIEECRCFAYRGERNQFCGVRKGPNGLPCPDDCCFGGCPDDGSRPPFRYIERPDEPIVVERTDPNEVYILILVLIVVLLGLLYIDLKIRRVR